jgi:hypothetical protein
MKKVGGGSHLKLPHGKAYEKQDRKILRTICLIRFKETGSGRSPLRLLVLIMLNAAISGSGDIGQVGS